MNSKKPIILLLTVSILALGIFALNMPLAYASPKSLYLVANHHTAQFDAWDIAAITGITTYQATYGLTHATDPAGVAIDDSSNTLFLSSEFSGGVEMVDATTMTSLGVSAGPSNLAGLAVDDANDIVYAVRRSTDDFYAYDWNPGAGSLTLKAGYPINLPGGPHIFGIELDDTTGILWVAGAAAGEGVKAYVVSTWTEDASKSFMPSHQPVGIGIDRLRGFVYTVSMTGGAGTPSGTGSTIISKWNLATTTETTYNTGHENVDVKVDEVTGYIYVTGGVGTGGDNLEVYDASTNPWTQVQATGDLGNPAGICIPRTEVAFNPLSLEKDDGLVGACVNPGDTITYTLSFNNTNPYAVGNVLLWDNMSAHTTFVTATGGGGGYPWSYDPPTHSVIWNLGNLTPASPDSVTLTVTVNPGTPPSTLITNFATIQPINIAGGQTTVFKETEVCPEGFVIPEVPMGTIMASAAMIIALIAYVAKPKWKRKPI